MVLNRIAIVAQERGLTPASVIRRSGVCDTTVYSLWHHREADFRISTMRQIAQALDVRLADLMEEVLEDH